MTVSAFTNGRKKFSHCVAVGGKEVVVYLEVDMKPEDVKEFANMLSIKDKVDRFYACVVINDIATPRTFVAHGYGVDNVTEMFDISTGVSPVKLLREVFAERDV